MRTDLTKKKIKLVVKRRYFLKTNKKNQKVCYFRHPLKLVSTDMIETISWIAEKEFRERSDYWPFKAFRATPGRCCAVLHYGIVFGTLSLLLGCVHTIRDSFCAGRKTIPDRTSVHIRTVTAARFL